MPNVSKCPHCFREITCGDAERMTRAEVETGLRQEFNLLHSEEVFRADMSLRIRTLAFTLTMLALVVGIMVSFPTEKFSFYSLILPFILFVLYFSLSVIAPKFLDTSKSLEDRFNEFKAVRGLS